MATIDVDYKIPAVKGLPTDVDNIVYVKREAIPIIFVPGIMGSRLKASTSVKDLPDIRWDPGSVSYSLKHYLEASPERRKRMLIGPSFNASYLIPADSYPVGDGFEGLMDDYRPFLEDLKRHKWEDLGKVLVFPIYGFAYNWTMSCDVNGILLAKRIKAIMKEAASVIGVCKKVILLTHSMGGLVARSAMLTHGAKDDVLGVVHGVHPANGAPAAYWRIKAGFEGTAAPSAVLGDSGPHVAALLANSPGGLELLPNKRYTASTGKGWLAVRNPDGTVSRLPKNDPYEEIYKVPASLDPTQAIGQSNNKYWGLVEPRLLDPGNQLPADLTSISSKEDRLDALASSPTWSAFCKRVDNASQFHESIGSEIHAVTFCVVGTGHTTTETIGFLAEEFSPIEHDDIYRSAALAYRGGPYHPDPKSSKVYHYPVRGFRGAMRSAAGKNLVAVLKGPSGNGDGTVPQTSADATLDTGAAKPGNLHLKVEHQPAYENDEVQKFVIKAINAMCVKYLS